MSSSPEYESMNVTAPLKNSAGMKCIACIAVSGAAQVVDLETLFGRSMWGGHYFTFHADGPKVYLALGSASGTIDPTAQGVGTTVPWVIPPDSSRDYRMLAGPEGVMGPSGAMIGAPTQVKYNFLHAVGASPGSATGWLRIQRSSLGNNEAPGVEFRAP